MRAKLAQLVSFHLRTAGRLVIKLGWVVLPEGFTSCCLSVTSLGNPVDRLESEGE